MKTRKPTPAWLRRAPWEQGTAGLIGLGLFMLMQPFWMEAFTSISPFVISVSLEELS